MLTQRVAQRLASLHWRHLAAISYEVTLVATDADGNAVTTPQPVILTQTGYNKSIPAIPAYNEFFVRRGYAQLENGRYALDILFNDIRHSGFFGEFGTLTPAPASLPDDDAWATPLAWAERRGHAEVGSMLRRHGAGPLR